MKITKLFKNKKSQPKNDNVAIKVDKKQLEKIVGGASTSTSATIKIEIGAAGY